MRVKQEKKLLKSMIKILNYSNEKKFNGIPFKIRLMVATLLVCLMAGWFYMFNRDAIMNFLKMGHSFDSIIADLLPYSIKTFIPPFMIGCFLSITVIIIYSKYCVWYELKKYIDKEKVLNRILELENKLASVRKTK